MATYDFSVRYTGDAVDSGRIPIGELAPSLLALAETFQEIQKIKNPIEPPLSLDIKATERGSFIADLVLTNDPNVIKDFIDLLTSKDSDALTALIGYLTIFSGLVEFVIAIYKKKIKNQSDLGNGTVKVTFSDNTTVEVPKESIEAYQNVTIRKNIHDTFEPVGHDGISTIEISSAKTEKIVVAKKDYDTFEVPKIENKELDANVSEVYLQIVNVAFEHGKWKFSNGATQFFASIEDQDFLDDVEKNIYQFGSTDSLKVRLKTKQELTGSGSLKTEFIIEKVLQHIPGSRQIELDFDDEHES